MPTRKKATTRKTTRKKIDIEKWDDYSYWTNLTEMKQQEMLEKFAEKHGMDMLAQKYSQRTLGLLIDPVDFTITEKTPLGVITVGVYDELYKARNKEGGFIWRACITKMDEKNSDSNVYIHYEWGDTIFYEVIEAICDRMGGWMRVAFNDLKKQNGIKD